MDGSGWTDARVECRYLMVEQNGHIFSLFVTVFAPSRWEVTPLHAPKEIGNGQYHHTG
jgi:hypothetical protein